MTHFGCRHLAATLVFLLFFGVSGVYAQDQPAKDTSKDDTSAQQPPPVKEEITVTGTRFERPIDLTPQSISVLPAEAIHERPLWNVQSLLEELPGVSYSRAGAVDGQVTIRGVSSNDTRMVLFIDGDRFRGRPSLEYAFLDPNEAERFEVIRGPAAALYGSDAMGGVVNVITRRATGDPLQKGFSLLPRIYSLGFSSANKFGAAGLELQGVGDGFDALITGNFRRGENYQTPNGEVLNSDFNIHTLSARIGYSPSVTQRFEAVAKIANVESGRAGAPGAPFVLTRDTPLKEKSLRFGYTGSQVTSWIQDVEASAYLRDMSTVIRSITATAANGNVDHRDTWVIGPTISGGKLLARSVIGSNGMLSYGVDLYNENEPPFEDELRTLDSSGNLVAFSPRAMRVRAAVQTDAGALAHYDWDPSKKLTVSLGGRYDMVRTNIDSKPALGESPDLSAAFARNLTAHDSKPTGSAGVIYRPIPELHLVGNFSTAFRTPTTFDKSGAGTVGALNTLPNADVKPESSKNYEAGVRVRLPAFNVNLTAFRSDYQDLLQYVFLNPTLRQTQNVGRATIHGFELDGTYEITKTLAFRFNAADTRGTNTVTNVPLPYEPPLNGMLALRRTWMNDYWTELTDRWSRAKTRIDPSQERPTDGYHAFSLYGGANLGRYRPELKAYRLTVGIENLTNKAYVLPATRELIGFPRSISNPLLEPGRSLTINLAAEF